MGERKVSSRYTAEIVRDLGKLPLAIVMAGNFLGTRPDFPIDIFIQQLKEGERLSLLNRIAGRGDPNVEAVLRISLEATSAERASRWRSLAVFPSAIDPHAAQAIWKMSSAEEARHELSEMKACSLLLHDGKRHFMHELMSDIARSDLKRSPVRWAAAHESFSRFYCEMLRRWNGNLLDGQVKLSIILSQDWRNIRAGHDWATTHRLESEAARKLCIDYALSGAYVVGLRQPFDVRFDWINDALGAVDSGAQQDVFARARLLDERGVAYREHGDPRRALDDHRLAMNISKSIPDVKVWALGNIGRALWELGKPRAATKWFRKSLEPAEAQSEGRAAEGMFDCLGLASRELGRPGDAVELHTKAREQASKIHDLRGQARALDNLGKDYLARGDKKENVIETFKKARKMAKDMHDDRIEAAVLDHLSEAHRMHEQLDEAMTYASQAVKLRRDLVTSAWKAEPQEISG